MYEVFLKMFGIGIGFFIIRIFLRQKFGQESSLAKIGTVFLLVQLIQTTIIAPIFANWLLMGLSFCAFFLFHFAKLKILESRFRSEFQGVLSQIILNMKMGNSFRQSLRFSMGMSQTQMTNAMVQVYDLVVFSPQKEVLEWGWGHVFLSEVVTEFRKIDQTRHKSVEKVENYRRKMDILEKFRRKSGRIRGQIHLQVTLMTIIYAAVFAFNAYMFPLYRYKMLITASIFFYLIGLLCVLLIGRRVRWNI